MAKFLTRKSGSKNQKGTKFPVEEYGGSAEGMEFRTITVEDGDPADFADAQVKELHNFDELDEKGTTFFYDGKPYHVELDEGLGIITIDERYQDENNVWHTSKNVFSAQGEDGQQIAKDAGGFYTDKIMEYLDSVGVISDPQEKLDHDFNKKSDMI